MRSLVQVLVAICFTATLFDAASTKSVEYQPQMVDDDVVDIAGVLTTKFQPFAVKVKNLSGKQVLAVYLRGQRNQLYVRFDSSGFIHRDNGVAPGNPFRILLRKTRGGLRIYLINQKFRIAFEREIPVSPAKVWLDGAYLNGRITKTAWSNYLCLPAVCGRPEASVEVPESMCKVVRDGDAGRIVGGSPANAGDHPWQVSVWKKKYEGNPPVEVWSHACGGTLIDECWVVSAAHCFPQSWDTTRWRVRVGDYYNQDGRDKEFSGYESSQNFTIEKIFSHHDYWTAGHATVNDVALIQLEKDADGRCAQFGRFVQPACLPTGDTQFAPGRQCVISGWGATQHGQKLDKYAKCLQKASVDLISNQQCKTEYPDIPGDKPGALPLVVIRDTMQCTETIGAKVTDACQGDSGGPLVCSSGTGSSFLWGITSWGKGCGKNYGIYTKVFSFIDFIEKRLLQECKFDPGA